MCGIRCSLRCQLRCEKEVRDSPPNVDYETLNRRGPDASKTVHVDVIDDGVDAHISLFASTLRLRGASTSLRDHDAQPLRNDAGDAFAWNGELFGGIDVGDDECDTDVLFVKLSACRTDENVLKTLRQLRGPYAFVFYHARTKRLWFGRDVFGRRSLLWACRRENGRIFFDLCSAVEAWDASYWQEVPAKGVFNVDVAYCYSGNVVTTLFTCHPELEWLDEIRESVCHSDPGSKISRDGEDRLTFSHRDWLGVNIEVKVQEMAGIFQKIEIEEDVDPGVLLPAACLPVSQSPADDADLNRHHLFVQSVLAVTDFDRCVNEFLTALRDSVALRVNNTSAASVAVLFSGGVDCSLLAAIADSLIPDDEPIDLLNVAFETTTSAPVNRDGSKRTPTLLPETNFDVPDRKTGLLAWDELRRVNPKRIWRFVAINVTKEELMRQKRNRVARLIYPLKTVLDDSIGCATWFAARGRGTLLPQPQSNHSPSTFTSSAKVVLVGSGADEQLGGYARHKIRFGQSGWTGLCQEVRKDVSRISSRNLGRDDRVISDHGRECRSPYLDEGVVDLIQRLPIQFKSDPRFEKGFGEKVLLRAAAWKSGLRRTAFQPKRAIQFGSRIAKLENVSCKKVKSTDIVL